MILSYLDIFSETRMVRNHGTRNPRNHKNTSHPRSEFSRCLQWAENQEIGEEDYRAPSQVQIKACVLPSKEISEI